MTDCVFCKIRDGQIPSTKVYEDERTLCIMDINPLNAGHCLVLTKAHAATIYEAEPADLQAAITTAKRVATAQHAALKPDGLNMLQANGPAASTSVPHFPLHRLRCWTNDGRDSTGSWSRAIGTVSRRRPSRSKAHWEEPRDDGRTGNSRRRRQAGARRSRPRREDRRAGAARRRL